MRTDVLVEDGELTLIRTSSTGMVDVVTAPIAMVFGAIERATLPDVE